MLLAIFKTRIYERNTNLHVMDKCLVWRVNIVKKIIFFETRFIKFVYKNINKMQKMFMVNSIYLKRPTQYQTNHDKFELQL